jgi:type IV pilus assembly protein PilC
LLLASGISVSDAMPLCIQVTQNQTAAKEMQTLKTSLASGKAFWESLKSVSFADPLLVELAKVGEESGTLTQTMGKCSEYFEAAHRASLRRMNKPIEPVITIFMGLILAAIMIAIILPTFELATVM